MSFNASSPDSNHKALSQRQYREKEADGFKELLYVISEVTGERDVTARHEILTKAAQSIRELNLQNTELRRQLAAASNSSRGGGSVQGYGPGPGPGGNDGRHYAASGTYGSAVSPWGNGNYTDKAGVLRQYSAVDDD